MRAVSFRWPEALIEEAQLAALRQGVSFTKYVREAIELRLGATLINQPMWALHEDTGQPTGHVSHETPETCAHPFRDLRGRCRTCGRTP